MTDKPSKDDLFGSIPISGGGPEKPEKPIRTPEEKEADQEPSPPQPRPSVRRRRVRKKSPLRLLTWLLALPVFGLVLYGVAGYLLVPYLVKSVFAGRMSRTLERSVTFGNVAFDPFTLALTLHNGIIGARTSNPDDTVDPILSFSRLKVDFEAVSLMKRGIVCRRADIDKLFLHMVRGKDSSYNIFELIPVSTDKAGQEEAGSILKRLLPSFPFSLNNISVHDSSLTFEDEPAGKIHQIKDISLALPTLSNFSYRTVQFIEPRFSAIINDSPVVLTGESRIIGSQVEARMNLHFKTDDLPAYLEYLPMQFNFITTKGKADLNLNLVFNSGGPSENRLSVEGTIDLADIWLLGPGGKDLARFPSIKLTGSFAPLVNQYDIKDLQATEPKLSMEKTAAGLYIIPWLKDNEMDQQRSVSEKTTLTSKSDKADIAIHHLLVKDGRLSYIDQVVSGGFADSWENIQLTIDSFASRGTRPASFAMSAVNKDNTRISCQGKIEANPVKITGLAIADQVDLAKLKPYIDDIGKRHFQSGSAAKLKTQFTIHSDNTSYFLKFTDLEAQLHEVNMTGNGRDILKLPHVAIANGTLDFSKHVLDVGDLQTENGFLLLLIDKNGKSIWQDISLAKDAAEQKNAWNVTFKSLEITKGKVVFEDHTYEHPLTLNFDNLSVLNGEAGKEQAAFQGLEMSAAVNTSGRVKCTGTLTASPFAADLQCGLDNLDLAALSPVTNNWIKPDFLRGTLNARGETHYPKPSFVGQIEIMDLAARLKDEPVLSCDRADFKDVTLSSQPFTLKTAAIVLQKPFFNLTLEDQDRSTLSSLFPTDHSSGTSPSPQHVIEIEGIEIDRGSFVFRDNAASPPYSATLSGITGGIGEVANRRGSRSSVSFAGLLQGQASASLSGSIGLFDNEIFADIEATISNMDVPPLARYLKSNLSAPVEKGLADINARIVLEKGVHQSSNRFRFSGLKLDSPVSAASQLPLAVALFYDQKGNVILEIPVSGSLSDPSFSYRAALLRKFRSILLKTAVSPFSFLASIAPLEGPLDHLLFPPGQLTLSPEMTEQLDALAKIMEQRPLLNLEIQGLADADIDRQAMLDALKEKLNRQRLEQESRLSKKLSALYGKEEVIVPGGVKTSNDLSASAKSNREALLELALKRSHAVNLYLSQKNGIRPERIKTSETGLLITEDSLGKAGNRVDFNLYTEWR